MRRIFPQPDAEITVAQAYSVPRRRHPDGRPWIGLCMVTSIDGSTVVHGNSQALSGPADREVLVGLRSLADVIVVGASTIRQEEYDKPSKPGLTIGIVTRTADLDLETNLFRSGAGFLILPEDVPVSNPDVRCVRAGNGSVDLPKAMRQLEGTFVQLEGGPTLNASMFAADLVDEINITISPLVVGGNGPRLTANGSDIATRFEVAHVLHDEGFLFIRYVRRDR
ncbi:MAG: dihydrofolate reductase family protein [Ilumatobacteraceae bacterium]